MDAVRFFLFLRGAVKYIDGLSSDFDALTKESVIAAQSTYDGSWKATQKLVLPDPGPREDVAEEAGGQTSDRMQEGDADAGHSSDDSQLLWSDNEEANLARWTAHCNERSRKAQHTVEEEILFPEFSDMLHL